MTEKPIEDVKASTSEAANHKRPPRTAQAHQPIRSVHKGHLKRTDQSRRVSRSREGAPLIQSDSSVKKGRQTPRHTRRKHRISQLDSSVGLSLDGPSSDGLSSDGPSTKSESSDQPIGFIGWSILVGLSSDGFSLDGLSFRSDTPR